MEAVVNVHTIHIYTHTLCDNNTVKVARDCGLAGKENPVQLSPLSCCTIFRVDISTFPKLTKAFMRSKHLIYCVPTFLHVSTIILNTSSVYIEMNPPFFLLLSEIIY
jgi:hypothetical protein